MLANGRGCSREGGEEREGVSMRRDQKWSAVVAIVLGMTAAGGLMGKVLAGGDGVLGGLVLGLAVGGSMTMWAVMKEME